MKLLQRVRAHLASPDSSHGKIAKGFFWVALFLLLGKLAGAAKEMAIAWRFGVGAEVDAYLFIFNLLNWPVSVWFSVLTIVLVPLAARIRRGSPADLHGFRAELLGWTLLLGLVLAGLAWLGIPWVLRSSWAGLPQATVSMAQSMTPELTLMVPIGVLIALAAAWMMAAGRHANTLLESVPALVILMAVLAFPADGVEPLVWGTVIGFALHLASLVLPQARQGEVAVPRLALRSPHWPAFWHGFGIMLAGQTLLSLSTVIDQFFAAHLGTGAIATLSYANRVLALLLSMGAMAVSRATLPVFSQAQAGQDLSVYRVAMHWAWLLLALGAGAMFLGWWLAPWGVRLLFQRGAFTADHAVVVTEVLRYGLTQLPPYFAGMVFVSLLASQRRHGAIAAAATAGLMVKVTAMLVLMPGLEVNGIAVSTSIMYAATLLFLGLGVGAGRKGK